MVENAADSYMRCPICNCTDRPVIFSDTIEASEWNLNGVHYDYTRCHHCGFIQSYRVPQETDLLQYYQEQYAYDWFEKNVYFKKLQAKHRLFKIRRYLEGAERVLDFGCGHGFFVEALAGKGYKSYGFDIGADKIMERKHARITNRNRLEEYTETGFDVITAWHVLEHMRDQDAVLEDLTKRLNPGGKLVIAVPNTGSFGFRYFGQKWGWTQQPYVHINQFNSANLQMLLENHGFSIVSVTTTDTWDQNLYDLLITYLFYRNKSRNPVRTYGSSVAGNLFFRINQLARLACTPLSYLVSAIRAGRKEGNELMVVAQKKIHGDI